MLSTLFRHRQRKKLCEPACAAVHLSLVCGGQPEVSSLHSGSISLTDWYVMALMCQLLDITLASGKQLCFTRVDTKSHGDIICWGHR